MKKNRISRNTFVKRVLKAGALAMLNPYNISGLHASPGTSEKIFFIKDDILDRLVIANDIQVDNLLQSDLEKAAFSRKIGYDFAILSASYSSRNSKYHHSPLIVLALDKLAGRLLSAQAADGTVNIGNLESPPDTAFLLELITAGTHLLIQEKAEDLNTVYSAIKEFLVKAGDGLSVGGVHTPNHRWVVCAALARLNALYPNEKYINRINEWLSEGVFINSDGNFPERSRIYSYVEDNALLTIARLLNKPALLDPVRKNLELTYYYMEPNGDLVTTDSRRQDQYMSKTIVSYYTLYRHLAIHDNNPTFAAIARLIEKMKGFEEEILHDSLFHFLEIPLLQRELPVGTPPPVNFEKMFTASNLLRIRHGNTTTTLFGGIDWPIIIASGRSNSPNFYSYRKGNAILKYMRLSLNFFGMGYFYSEGITKNGNTYALHKKLEVPYYQPLPKNLRKPDADYKLSPSIDGRFWNKMDFEKRPVSNVKSLETTVSFSETNGRNELTFHITGQVGVPVTIELCFREGGKLSGISDVGNGNSFLEKGDGQYEFEGDIIKFGPGTISHRSINGLEGERYSTHFGTLRTEGMHVYLTGVTPFDLKLVFS